MRSSWLPGKSLFPFGNTTVIGYLIASLHDFGFSYNQIFVATSVNADNIPLIQHIKDTGKEF
jgi:spore coat polysaccharide biosynthesis protein SpsF (cytidylyltransferase family)